MGYCVCVCGAVAPLFICVAVSRVLQITMHVFCITLRGTVGEEKGGLWAHYMLCHPTYAVGFWKSAHKHDCFGCGLRLTETGTNVVFTSLPRDAEVPNRNIKGVPVLVLNQTLLSRKRDDRSILDKKDVTITEITPDRNETKARNKSQPSFWKCHLIKANRNQTLSSRGKRLWEHSDIKSWTETQ